MYLSLLVRSYLLLGLHEKAHNSFSYRVGSRRILHQNCRVQWDVKLYGWHFFNFIYQMFNMSSRICWTILNGDKINIRVLSWDGMDTWWKILRSQVWILELHNRFVLSLFFFENAGELRFIVFCFITAGSNWHHCRLFKNRQW